MNPAPGIRWMPRKDLNLDKENQNLLCYHYTTGQEWKNFINHACPDARGGEKISGNARP